MRCADLDRRERKKTPDPCYAKEILAVKNQAIRVHDPDESKSASPSSIGIGIMLFLLLASCVGCVDPITQLKCDIVTKTALNAIRDGDTEALNATLCDPGEGPELMAQLRDLLPHGRIRYQRDSFLFPRSTYLRYYQVDPDIELDGNATYSLPLGVIYFDRERSICIRSIFVE